MKNFLDKFKVKESKSGLYQWFITVILLGFGLLLIDVLFNGFGLHQLYPTLRLTTLLLIIGWMTLKLKWRLLAQYIVIFVVLFANFAVSGILHHSTVDWTSYLIYFLTSTVFAVFYTGISYILREKYRKTY